MKAAIVLRRLCLGRGTTPSLRAFSTNTTPRLKLQTWHTQISQRWSKACRGKAPIVGSVLFAAALGPGAFMELAERNGEEETGEKHMLEASRQEIRKTVSEDARGLTRLRQELYVFLYCYVYEPVATGFRFLHLTIIFLPVLVSVPMIWIGNRNPERNNQRWGTLWWFDFLVKSMERAGPAFIKVWSHTLDEFTVTNSYIYSSANGLPPEQISSLPSYVLECPPSTHTHRRTLYMPPKEYCAKPSMAFHLTRYLRNSRKSR